MKNGLIGEIVKTIDSDAAYVVVGEYTETDANGTTPCYILMNREGNLRTVYYGGIRVQNMPHSYRNALANYLANYAEDNK